MPNNFQFSKFVQVMLSGLLVLLFFWIMARLGLYFVGIHYKHSTIYEYQTIWALGMYIMGVIASFEYLVGFRDEEALPFHLEKTEDNHVKVVQIKPPKRVELEDVLNCLACLRSKSYTYSEMILLRSWMLTQRLLYSEMSKWVISGHAGDDPEGKERQETVVILLDELNAEIIEITGTANILLSRFDMKEVDRSKFKFKYIPPEEGD